MLQLLLLSLLLSTILPGEKIQLTTLVLPTFFGGSLYAPLFLFYKAADWKISEFGFVVNKKVGLIVLFSAVVLGYSFIKGSMTGEWHASLIEAFARTGVPA